MTDFRLVSGNWREEIAEPLRADPGPVRIVCPFIKLVTLQRILDARPRRRLEVITRFELGCFYDCVSDIEALRQVVAAGGSVKGVKGLHAKLFIFGGSRVVAGSANLTEAAMHRNHEFGFASAEPGIVANCRSYFDALWRKAGPEVTLAQLDAWDQRVRTAQQTFVGTRPDLEDFGTVVKVTGDEMPLVARPSALPDDVRYFVKFFGSGGERSSPSRSILDDVREGRRHRYCTYGRPTRQIEDGSVIFMARVMQPSGYRVFGRATGLAHRRGVDMLAADELERNPRHKRWPYLVRVHDARFIDGVLEDGVSLHDLMDEFEEESFAPTSRNARAGSGNRDPRQSLTQKPHMELTPLSAAWLDQKLDQAFRCNGTLDLRSLEP